MEDRDNFDESYLIKVANASDNVLIDSGVQKTEIIGIDVTYQITCFNGPSLPSKLATSVFQLFLDNMKSFYQSSSWGFDETEKKQDFRNPMNRYIIVLDKSDDLVAFCLFRFEYDDEDEPEHPVLYCYELQVKHSHRGQKIGAQLMSIIAQIAAHYKMWKTMLTVFKANVAAINFYTKLGFGIDANSPSSFGHHEECYEIFSDKPKLT